MKLIVGLGNPGEEYAKTRHNIGFMTIDSFAEKNNTQFKLASKLKGMLAEVRIGTHKALLLKPMTYMNLSGESVSAVMKYYKIAIEDLLIISDDLDSHIGRVRIRSCGSAGGHNGHKSIIEQIGTTEYKRIKIGIDRSEAVPVVDWVLSRFKEEEMPLLVRAMDKSHLAIEDFINDISFEKIASCYSEK